MPASAPLRRDLHDGVGPSLAAVTLRIETARNLARKSPQAADAMLEQATDDVAAVLADVRRLVHDQRPPALDELGLDGAVAQLAERFDGGLAPDALTVRRPPPTHLLGSATKGQATDQHGSS